MEGVLPYLVVGALLFAPLGFFTAYFQHQKEKKEEKENS